MRATTKAAHAARVAGAGALLAVLGLVVTLHTRQAAYFLDDHLIDTIVRAVDDPLWFFTHRHFFAEHLHRPMGFFSWWALGRTGRGAEVQLAGNAWLLVVNGGLLGLLLARWRVPPLLALLAAAVAITHPAAVVFASWAANRFELLATAFGLGCLLAWTAHLQGGARPGAAWAAAACAAAALLSKESAVLLAPVALVMAATAARSAGATWQRRLVRTLLVVMTLLLALAGYRLALDVRLPREVIEANQGLAWMAGMAKWWRHLPAVLLAGLDTPAWAGTLALAVLPVLVLALVARAAWVARAPGADPSTAWPLLVGGVIVLTMPVIQVGHLSLATMAFLDAKGQMTGLFVERFYYQGLIGLLMIAAGLLAQLAPPAGAWRPPLGVGGAVVAAALLAWQVRVSLHATQAWPGTTIQLQGQAQAAVDAVLGAGAEGHPRCRVRLAGVPSPVFQAMTEAMVKWMGRKSDALGRCIIESDGEQMITLTHRDRLAEYRPKVEAGAIPRVGPWVFLRPTLAGGPVTPVTHAWHFDGATGRFLPTAP